MSYIYKNITGNTATDLEIKDTPITLTNMLLCNVHDSDTVLVDLYLTRTFTGELPPNDKDDTRTFVGENGNWNALPETILKYYILKAVSITVGATLSLDRDTLTFDNILYALYIQLNGSDSAVDIIINANDFSPSSLPSSLVSSSSTY